MKAATQIRAQTDFTRTYGGYNYKFYVTTLGDLPDPYYFSSDVIDYIIETCGKAQRYQIENRSNIVPINWAQQTITNIMNSIYSTVVNAYVATGNLIHNILDSDTWSYRWDFSCTGIDDTYPGWDTYGTAYGFRFVGACGDVIDLTLDSQGDFYGHNPIGNYTIDPDPVPYNWILINQGLDNFYEPTIDNSNFNDLDSPYIEGKTLHFFVYVDNVKQEWTIEDFTEVSINFTFYSSSTNNRLLFRFLTPNSNNYPNEYPILKIDGNSPTITNSSKSGYIYNSNINYNGYWKVTEYSWYYGTSLVSFNLPSLYGATIDFNTLPTVNGMYQNQRVNKSCNIYLKANPYTVNPSPNPIPETPIPIIEIPSNPDDPIPSSDPDPVPGITYPINPTPIPLPPYVSIVSGNDDLWGLTVDLNGVENSLLPYLNSLANFEFPSFDSLISDFSGSIIWVAQIMSVLYNGTSFNVLFIVLCLFSLVSIIIGGYKLWSTTEPDPNNPGFRRTKKPPKGSKGRRRR